MTRPVYIHEMEFSWLGLAPARIVRHVFETLEAHYCCPAEFSTGFLGSHDVGPRSESLPHSTGIAETVLSMT